jgi:hypothetical protein
MDPAWTTTAASPRSGGYTLRADTKETRTLRIRAVQQGGSDATVLYCHPEATPDYDDEQDACKLFSSETAVSVYSFSPANEPLAIHASNDFGSAAIRLGLRLKEAGQVTLHFSGMETFAHEVYLTDHSQNNKKTDIRQNPSYTFTAVKQSPDDEVTELNDRFSLEIRYTGTLNETIRTKNVSVTAKDGYICVQTPRPAESIQVYTTAGALVYATRTRSDNYRIQAESSNTYIIKVTMNGEYVTEKVFVR